MSAKRQLGKPLVAVSYNWLLVSPLLATRMHAYAEAKKATPTTLQTFDYLCFTCLILGCRLVKAHLLKIRAAQFFDAAGHQINYSWSGKLKITTKIIWTLLIINGLRTKCFLKFQTRLVRSGACRYKS